MRERNFALAFALCATALAVPPEALADATKAPTALRPRVGLTAGGHDHFLGQLSPDGKALYYVGNANRTAEVFVQDSDRGLPRVLFDDHADVSQPRPSPDGKHLLYISYQQDAGGDACLFDLRRRTRRCLTQRGTAVLHVFWFPDGKSVGALTRTSLDATHELLRLPIDGGSPQVLVRQNMSAPAVSPDGRWLVYVPLGREGKGALKRSIEGLRLQRLDRAGAKNTLDIVPTLPGASSFPAFSHTGDWLYFTQYLNDTNFDGAIDGNDNGVLFRLPFATTSMQPVRAQTYEQLTSGRTNCQYPAPARDRLIATCERAGFLQIYRLPLEGLVPDGWSQEQMEKEIAASRDPGEWLLLLRRMIAMEGPTPRRLQLYRRLVMHHLATREYESADHYLSLLAKEVAADQHLVEWSEVHRELIGHRREEQRLRHAKLDAAFISDQRQRLERLDRFFASSDPSTQRLARLAQSEIYLVLGEKARALKLFDAISLEHETDVSVLHVWGRHGEALLRDLGDRARWMNLHRTLAGHPAFDERTRLHHATQFILVLARGRAPGAERPLLEKARAETPDGSELALLLDLEAALLEVPRRGEQAMLPALEALWAGAPTFERHRAVAMATIAKAARNDWGLLLATFGQRWLADVPAEHEERKYAEALYAEVMLERAYVERKQGQLGKARELFLEITRATPSLEAHIGFIEADLESGTTPDRLREDYRKRYAAEDPVEAFAEAYIAAHSLSELTDPAHHAAEVERARALLRPVAEARPRSVEVHHLYAYLAHRHYHRTGDKAAAMAANTRYHLALDLAVADPRRRANLLTELGLLQAALGNHRIALKHFDARTRLPFLSAQSEIGFRLARARSLFHSAAYLEAKGEVARATQVIEAAPELKRFLPVVLDLAGLYHYAAGVNDKAVEYYRRLIDITSDHVLAVRFKAQLGQGAAAQAAGQHEVALKALKTAYALLNASEAFRKDTKQRKTASHFDRDDYRPLVAGLLAEAHLASGDLPATTKALEDRRALFQARYAKHKTDAYLLEVARTCHRLGVIAYRQGQHDQARRYFEQGLVAADDWRQSSKSEIEEVSLALLRGLAELHVQGGVPVGAFQVDLGRRLAEGYAHITKLRNPDWDHERFLFPIYLTAVELAVPRKAKE